MDRTVTRQGPAQRGSTSGWPVACGFVISCRKDFTTRVQVILRVCFTKAGDRETKEGLWVEEATRASLGGALLWLHRSVIGKRATSELLTGKSEEKGALETGSGVKPGGSCHCHCSSGFKSHGDP